jgi:hypothetical protein
LTLAFREFNRRHVLNRTLVRACAGRSALAKSSVLALGGIGWLADRIGASRVAKYALSAAFGVGYWQGVCDEVGNPRAVRQTLEGAGAAR